MDYKRVSNLYAYLNDEFKKSVIDYSRVAEINHYLSKEFTSPPPAPSFWSKLAFTVPSNWKTYVTYFIGAFVAFNGYVHVVGPDLQNGLLAAAVALGVWSINSTQNEQAALQSLHFENMKVNYEGLKAHLALVGEKMGISLLEEKK